MRKIRMVCMECNRVTDLPERKADGKRCECGGELFPLGWADELDVCGNAPETMTHGTGGKNDG